MPNVLTVHFPDTVGLVVETNPLTGAKYIYFFTPDDNGLDNANAGVGHIYLEEVTTYTWEPEEEIPPPPPTPEPTFPFAYETIVGNLRMRENPTTTALVLKTLPLGSVLYANDENITATTAYDWQRLSWQDPEHNTYVTGWVAVRQISTNTRYVKKIRG